MALKDQLENWISQLKENLNEQPWFQTIKGRWEELDTQSRQYVTYAVGFGGALLVGLFFMSFILSVRSVKGKYFDRVEQLGWVNSAAAEKRALMSQGLISRTGGKGSSEVVWTNYLRGKASALGIKNEQIKFSSEKKEKNTEVTEEALFEMNLEKVNVKQLVNLTQAIRTGNQPVKLRKVAIKTRDGAGNLDVKLSFSAFRVLAAQ